MARKNKKLYYEVLPPDEEECADEKADDSTVDASGEDGVKCVTAVASDADDEVDFVRDAYAELNAAAQSINRARFRVQPDLSDGVGALALFMAAVIMAGCIFMYVIKNDVGKIVVGAIMIAAVIIGAAVMIYQSVKSRRIYYCYFSRGERGVCCMSVIEDRAVIFIDGTAYVIDGDVFYSVDEKGFVDFLDGECVGLVSVLDARREDVELIDNGLYFVANRVGGGHTVTVEDGRITKISSEQPFYTDDTDAATGERKVKTKTYLKTIVDGEFSWEIPPFVKDRLTDNGIDYSRLV